MVRRNKKLSYLNALRNSGNIQKALCFSISIILCIIWLSRYQLLDNFSMLPGDRYDAVIVTVILEHWFHVFSGEANWLEVNYYFPYKKTIAQTDAYFLISLIYYPLRLLSFDPFLSVHMTSWVLKILGFVGVYLLFRKVFSYTFYWSLLGAILFTISNGITIHSQRIQLETISFAPILLLFLWNTINAFFNGNTRDFVKYGIIASILYGAWCLTCFYMAWFFVFFFTTFIVITLMICGKSNITLIKARFMTMYGYVILVIVSSIVCLSPFLYAFLSKSLEVGTRLYKTVVNNTIPIEGILQVGYDNILFGRFYNYILSFFISKYTPNGEYYNTGFPIILFLLFACGCINILKKQCKTIPEVVFKSIVIATLFTWFLTLNFAGYSAWFFIYYLFPGAKALNVVAIYQLFLALPLIIIAIKYLSTKHFRLPIIIIIVILLIAEELNKPIMNLDRKVELTRINFPIAPFKECKAFYVSGWKEDGEHDWIYNYYAHNVTAMFVAQNTKIPTINGVASFSYPDWDFGYPNNPDYDERILNYAKKHNIKGLCKLDLNNKQWEIIIK